MKWWGDVPVLRNDITPDEAKAIARSPKADVLKFIEDELDAATAALPTKDQYTDNDNGRITKGAALALKARVLLYEGNRMADVAAICEQLINNQGENGNYSLVADYTDLFSNSLVNKKNNESILSLQFVPGLRTWGEYIDFAPISAGARSNNLSPTQELVNNYIMLNGKQFRKQVQDMMRTIRISIVIHGLPLLLFIIITHGKIPMVLRKLFISNQVQLLLVKPPMNTVQQGRELLQDITGENIGIRMRRHQVSVPV